MLNVLKLIAPLSSMQTKCLVNVYWRERSRKPREECCAAKRFSRGALYKNIPSVRGED